MTRVAVLLHGVDVGSRNPVAEPQEPDELMAGVRERLASDLGLAVAGLVRTGPRLEAALPGTARNWTGAAALRDRTATRRD